MTYTWHQARAAGLHALPYDTVGYTVGGTLYCLDHDIPDADTQPVFREQVSDDTCDVCGEYLDEPVSQETDRPCGCPADYHLSDCPILTDRGDTEPYGLDPYDN